MPFSEPELEYLASQRVLVVWRPSHPTARPRTVPWAFATTPRLTRSTSSGGTWAPGAKFRNIQTDPRVSFVVDDVASVDPWRVRGVEIRGDAQALTEQDTYEHLGSNEIIRIHPQRTFAWGLDRNTQLPPDPRVRR